MSFGRHLAAEGWQAGAVSARARSRWSARAALLSLVGISLAAWVAIGMTVALVVG